MSAEASNSTSSVDGAGGDIAEQAQVSKYIESSW